jgi:hypothetical protein
MVQIQSRDGIDDRGPEKQKTQISVDVMKPFPPIEWFASWRGWTFFLVVGVTGIDGLQKCARFWGAFHILE